MSQTEVYEVEDLGTETVLVHCRRCGRTWEVFAETPRGWWRCPGEPHDEG
jgi:hypothetical protein